MIQINCDVGEGMNNEATLFRYINSCSIACGGHAGDEVSMRQILKLAQTMGVAVGAHPSYPDKENFGRKSIPFNEQELITSIQQQVNDLKNIAASLGMELKHIKAHGALYNDAAKNEKIARLFLHAISHFQLPIYAPAQSMVSKLAKAQNIQVIYEAFADRNYNADGSLVSRSSSNAIIVDPIQVVKHINLIKDGVIQSRNGELFNVKANTLCLHSDSPNALEILKHIRAYQQLQFKNYGGQGVLITWPNQLKRSQLNDIVQFKNALHENGFQHVIQSVASLLVIGAADETALREIYLQMEDHQQPKYNRYIIPVCYDQSFGTDLTFLSQELALSVQDIIDLHSSGAYTVYALGFLPGFMYLGGLDKRLHADRKDTPQLQIPQGAVGIGGQQTGIYPKSSPGGWQIIGRTPIELFDPNTNPPCFAQAGDEIKFQRISKPEYETGEFKLRKEVIND